MTRSTVSEALARVELRNTPFPIVLRLWGDDHDLRALQIVLTVPHRDTGQTSVITHNHPIGELELARVFTVNSAIEWIYSRVQIAIDHELREWWHVDGKRTRDPHRDDPGAP